jgi:hypothetical protein
MVLGMMEEATIIKINKLREIYDKRGGTLTHNFTKKYSRFWPECFFFWKIDSLRLKLYISTLDRI